MPKKTETVFKNYSGASVNKNYKQIAESFNNIDEVNEMVEFARQNVLTATRVLNRPVNLKKLTKEDKLVIHFEDELQRWLYVQKEAMSTDYENLALEREVKDNEPIEQLFEAHEEDINEIAYTSKAEALKLFRKYSVEPANDFDAIGSILYAEDIISENTSLSAYIQQNKDALEDKTNFYKENYLKKTAMGIKKLETALKFLFNNSDTILKHVENHTNQF